MFSSEVTPVKFLCAFDLHREKGYIYTTRNSFYALSIRLSGSTTFNIKGQTISAQSGELIVIPPNLVYSQYTEGEHIIAIHFDSLKYFNINTIQKHTIKNWDQVCELFIKIYECDFKKPQGWYYKASSYLYELLSLIHNNIDNIEHSTTDNIDLAKNFLEAHYTDRNLTVKTLAKISGYSEAYFRRIFLKRFGTTPSEKIDQLRLERAKRLLESKKHNMQEIAEDVGIIDPKYFSTWFKKHLGFSPRDYLNKLVG